MSEFEQQVLAKLDRIIALLTDGEEGEAEDPEITGDPLPDEDFKLADLDVRIG